MTALARDEIELNSYKYRIKGQVVGSYLDPFPNQISIGDASYDNRLELSSWAINDLRDGIGVEEMDEATDQRRSWWTNCITQYRGHILPSRLATSITFPVATTAATITNGDMELAANWTNGARSNVQAHGGTFSWLVNATTAYQDAVTWTNAWRSRAFTVQGWIYGDGINYDHFIQIDDGVGITSSQTSTTTGWTQVAVTRVLDAAATRLRINLTAPTGTAYFDDVVLYYPNNTTGHPIIMTNYGGYLYFAQDKFLCKLNAGRTGFTDVANMPASITALIPGIGGYMYILMGDSENYWYYGATINRSNSANAYWGVWYDNKLFKCNTSGDVAYSSNPSAAAPTWASAGDISDMASQMEGFVVGRDASGSQVPYAATNSIIKVYDSATPAWLDTEVKLPNHPNGGKGAAYFNGKLYFSYGLAVKEYYPETGALIDVGLTERDGLPIEYNGEIVKLVGESGIEGMFALVDASQVSGTSKSGLYLYDGGWHCWWPGPDVLLDNCDDAWNTVVGAGVTSTADTSDYQMGIASAKMVVPASLTAGNTITAENLASTKNISGCNYVALWIKSSVALDANDLQLVLLDSGSGTLESLNIPAVAANTWTKVSIALVTPSADTAVFSARLDMIVDKGAFTVWLDDVKAVYYDGAMTDCIVSSASSAYAVYLDHAGTIYYIDIPRGIENPDKITQYYAASGILLSPWFDAGNQVAPKLAKLLADFANGVTATETVSLKYRIDHTYTDLDTGWTTMDTLDITGESGYNEELFASGAGISFKAIQFRLDFVTAGSTAKADIQSLVLYFKKRTGSEKLRTWAVTVIVDEESGGPGRVTAKQKATNLNTAITSGTDVLFAFHPNDNSLEQYYVSVECLKFSQETGREYLSNYELRLVES